MNKILLSLRKTLDSVQRMIPRKRMELWDLGTQRNERPSDKGVVLSSSVVNFN